MSLLNKQNCKGWLLDYANRTRAHHFTRVSMEGVVDRLEAALRKEMRRIVDEQPSVGKTIKA